MAGPDREVPGHRPGAVGEQHRVLAGAARDRRHRARVRRLSDPLRGVGRIGHREGRALRARRAPHGTAGDRRPNRQRAATHSVLRRPPARPHRVAGPAMGVGGTMFEDGDFNTATHVDLPARRSGSTRRSGRRRRCSAATPTGIAVLARRTRRRRNRARRWKPLHADRAASGARQAVLVGDRLRHRDPVADPDRPE